MFLRFVILLLVAGCFGETSIPDGYLGVGSTPLATGWQRWETSWRFSEETRFWDVCAEGSGGLSIAIQDITEGKIMILAQNDGTGAACVSPNDGAFGDLVFLPNRTYRLVSFGAVVEEHWIGLRAGANQ